MIAQNSILDGLRMKRARTEVNERSIPRHTKLAAQMKKGKKVACYESRYLNRIMATSLVTRQAQISERIVDMATDNLSIMIHTNGDRYIGTSKDGVPHGHGTAVAPDADMYTGEWYMGTPQGEGIYFWNDGVAYMGMWHDGRRHGRGIFLADNISYPCEYEHGNMIAFDGQLCEAVCFMKPKRKTM